MRNRILVVAGVAERFVVGEGVFQEMVLVDQDSGEELAFPLVPGQYERLREYYEIDQEEDEGTTERTGLEAEATSSPAARDFTDPTESVRNTRRERAEDYERSKGDDDLATFTGRV
jgi:hypothetical protein